MKKYSDGWYHERNARRVLIIGIPLGILCLFWKGWLGFGFILGLLFGFFIDPDLDHPQTTHSEYRVYKFGKVPGVLFQMYFTPYQAIWHHASEWTHGGPLPLGWLVMLLVATPIRILYSFLWVTLLLYKWPHQTLQVLVSIPLLLWLGLYLGWALQDLVHWLRDYIGDGSG